MRGMPVEMSDDSPVPTSYGEWYAYEGTELDRFSTWEDFVNLLRMQRAHAAYLRWTHVEVLLGYRQREIIERTMPDWQVGARIAILGVPVRFVACESYLALHVRSARP